MKWTGRSCCDRPVHFVPVSHFQCSYNFHKSEKPLFQKSINTTTKTNAYLQGIRGEVTCMPHRRLGKEKRHELWHKAFKHCTLLQSDREIHMCKSVKHTVVTFPIFCLSGCIVTDSKKWSFLNSECIIFFFQHHLSIRQPYNGHEVSQSFFHHEQASVVTIFINMPAIICTSVHWPCLYVTHTTTTQNT